MVEVDKKYLRKITISEVEPGMVLEDAFNDQGVLLLSNHIMVKDREQIENLKKRGVSFVLINIHDGMDIPVEKLKKQELFKREEEYYKELSRAKKVHQITLEAAKNTLHAVRMGRQFVSKEVEIVAEKVAESILRNTDAILSLAQIKGYDEYTYVHSVNVGVLLTSVANAMQYTKSSLIEIGIGGLLHDIGKMRIPEHILNKAGKYTDNEFAVMKRHPQLGLDILRSSRSISDLSRLIVFEHHERFNGKGYPRGITGGQISEVGVMAAVADVYDAMTTDRVYRPAWTPQRALAMIFQGCDIEFPRRIVEFFTRHIGIYPVGSFVRLGTGELGVVIRVEKGKILAPDVLVLYSAKGVKYLQPMEYKLSELQNPTNGKTYYIESSLNPKNFNVNISEYIQKSPFE
ncbi:MAG TPA: HD-GYP domain-containing protein [Chitinispirillaceae bacterium]|nr:HD-GYP domain-containing protein [Chitinispirillaceae bacterium]